MSSQTIYATDAYKPDFRRIVSIDGEGKTRSNPHVNTCSACRKDSSKCVVHNHHSYVLLAAADDRGMRSYIQHDGSFRERELRDGERYTKTSAYSPDDRAANYGLSTVDCLEWLLSLPSADDDLFISFSFTYDYTMILKDLPLSALDEFGQLGFVVWNGYIISGIPRKFFEVRRANASNDRRIKVWDVFSYWQMSFVKALNSSFNLFDDAQKQVIEFIAEMKLERDHLELISDAQVREYCFSECTYLSIIYRDLLKHSELLGIKQTGSMAHGGPGAVAAQFYASDDVKLKVFMPDGDPRYYLAGLPVDVPIFSYHGGRFETRAIGPLGDLIEYDIQSAYPAIAVDLPCLKCGSFREVTEYEDGKLGFYFVGSNTSGPWAPFPFRSNADTGRAHLNGASKGSIAFVHGGKRWVTSYELEIARKYFGKDAIPVYSGWVYDQRCDHEPFKRVRELYLWRKIGDPRCNKCLASKSHFCDEHPAPSPSLSKIIKLIINSIYGKLAQSIGTNRPYQSYIWASWITGGTRARVLEAALIGGRKEECPNCKNGEMFRACEEHASVWAIATDGILSREDIPELYVTDWQLGTWERTPKPDAWLGMPGIYSFRDYGKPDKCDDCKLLGIACKSHADDKKFKRRGLDSRYFPAEHLREAWERGQWEVKAKGKTDDRCLVCRSGQECEEHCPECKRLGYYCPEHPPRAFMPLRLAITRKDALDVLGEWIPATKTVRFRSVRHKRNFPSDVMRDDPTFAFEHSGDLMPLIAIKIPSDVVSAPYVPAQSWDATLTKQEVFQAWDEKQYGRGDDPDLPMWADWEDTPENLEIGGMQE